MDAGWHTWSWSGAARGPGRGRGGARRRAPDLKSLKRNNSNSNKARRTNLVPGSTSSRVGGRAEGVLSVTGKVAHGVNYAPRHREGISLHWEMKSRSEAATDRPIATDLRERHQDNVQKHCGGSQGETLPIDIHSTHSQTTCISQSHKSAVAKMLPSLLRVLPLLHLDGLSAPTRRSRDAQANLLNSLFRGNADSSSWSGQSVDVAPSWSELKAQWEGAATADERSFRALLESGRLPHASALAKRRLFDLPDGQEPRVTFYRDTAAWCPYCEKVWLTLEEKRVPYTVEKVNMNCYGDKPAWFWAMQPSGGIPVAKLDGQVIRESNDIIMAIERAFPEHPMLPNEAYLPDQAARTQPLFRLERELFNAWFRWMTSSVSEGAQRKNLESILIRVEGELGVAGATNGL